MSHNRYTPARLRYLRARLSILLRPSFLVGVVFLSVLGLVVKEYWTNPDFLRVSQNQEVFSSLPEPSSNSQSSLSDEDRAIAADIGNLSVLDYDKEQAKITETNNVDDNKKVEQKQLTNILDAAKKYQKSNNIKSKINLQTTNQSLLSVQNPFIQSAKNLLNFKFGLKEKASIINNSITSFSGLQPSPSSFNLGIINNNLLNTANRNAPESALQSALNQSNNQKQNTSAATTSENQNQIRQLGQNANNSTLPTTSANQRLRPDQRNQLVDTNIWNQPLNNPVQNSYSNFNNIQRTIPDYNQPRINNTTPNYYNNFNNTSLPTINNNQPSFSNQLQQNPNRNFNNRSLPGRNYNQPNFNNQLQQQNPYRNFNNNQLPVTNNNQPNFNNQPQQNLNNNRFVNRFSPEVQQRLQNAYDRLINRNNLNRVNPNNYSLPINRGNTVYQQPNIQQLNSPYSNQNPAQYNGFRYR